MRSSLGKIFSEHKDYLSDKWQHYPFIYETEIGPLVNRGQPIDLLEIGVQNGGSLQIWSKFLPPGSRIVGIDVNPKCLDLKFPEGVDFILGSACDMETVKLIPIKNFDIIIDDGSHVSEDIIASFALLIDKLKPGGRYIIEDVETSYQREFGGGFRSPGSTVEWAKGFVDALNADHIAREDLDCTEDGSQLQRFSAELFSVSFYDAVISFQKLKKPKTEPFGRFFSGSDATVMDPLDWISYVDPEVFGKIGMQKNLYNRISGELVRKIQFYENERKLANQRISEITTLLNELKKTYT